MEKTSRYMKSQVLDDTSSSEPALVSTRKYVMTLDKKGFTQLLQQLPAGQYPLSLGSSIDGVRGLHSVLLSVGDREVSFFDQNMPLFFEKASREELEHFASHVFTELQQCTWDDDKPLCPLGVKGVFSDKQQADTAGGELKRLSVSLHGVDCQVTEQLEALRKTELDIATGAEYEQEDYVALFSKQHWNGVYPWQYLASYAIENEQYKMLLDALENVDRVKGDSDFFGELVIKAVQREDTTAISLLLENPSVIKAGCLLRPLSESGDTVLQLAMKTDNQTVIDSVLSAMGDAMPSLDQTLDCAMDCAAYGFLSYIFDFLSIENQEEQSVIKAVLEKSIKTLNLDLLLVLLDHTRIKDGHLLLVPISGEGKTALQLALDARHGMSINELLKCGASIEGCDDQLLELLLSRELPFPFKKTLLIQAMSQGGYYVLEQFLSHVSQEDRPLLDDLLKQAIVTENIDAVEIMADSGVLHKLGCLGRAISEQGQSAQELAASIGNKDIITALEMVAKNK